MTAPVNDDRSGALLVSSTGYSGVVLGGEINTDTTEDAGGPVDGFGARDVFYYWSSLPAGNVYIYIQPRGGPAGAYFEAGTFSGSPTSWTSADGFPDGFGSGGASTGTCRFQHWHTGGDLSLVVYTYVGDSSGDTMTFDFGWGHDLDAASAHWSTNQTESYDTVNITGTPGAELDISNTRRGIKQTYTAMSPGLSVPPESLATCAFDNARDGVVDIPSPTTYGCSYIGPGEGTTLSGFADSPQSVGAYYLAVAIQSIPPAAAATGRSDRVGVDQTLSVLPVRADKRGPIADEHSVTPTSWSTFRSANEGADAELVWGWDYVDASPAWDTRNYHLGSIGVSDAYTTPPYSVDTYDPVDVVAALIPQGVIYNDEATVGSAADRVWLPYDGSTDPASYSYLTPASTGSVVFHLADASTTSLDVASEATFNSYLVTSTDTTGPDTKQFVALMFTTQATLDDTPPTFGDPPRSGSYATIANRTLATTDEATFETRVPTWRAFIGFPITPPTGWRVGRIGAGETPW